MATANNGYFPLTPEKVRKKITVLSVAGLLADAIDRIHRDASVSELFVPYLSDAL